MSMRKTFKVILGLCFVAMSLAGMQAERNLLVKAQVGDWAQYLFNSQNETVPMLSVKDQQRWRVISVVEETGVRIDESFIMAGERSGPMGTIANFNRPFEPVSGLGEAAKIDILSSSQENQVVNGTTYSCTKIVRKVTQAADIMKGQTGWKGTSTIWICPDIPVGGIVRIENRYESQLTADAEPHKIVETWTLTNFGFKNWKD
jgi:hypothetical protein